MCLAWINGPTAGPELPLLSQAVQLWKGTDTCEMPVMCPVLGQVISTQT
jgi:hypothetical protein